MITSKHLKSNKIKKIKGVEIKTKSKNTISIIFPKIAYPQYWDEPSQKFVQIENNQELQTAITANQKLSYGGLLLIKKDSVESKEVKKTLDNMWKYYKLDDVKKPRFGKYPLEDGDVKADELEEEEKNGDMYRGNWMLKIASNFDNKTNIKRFRVFDKYDKSGNYMPESNETVSGCFCRVGITLDFYDFGSNIGLKAYMNAIQILDKNPLLQMRTDYSNEFEFEKVSEEEKEKALNKVLDTETEPEPWEDEETLDV